MTAPDLAALAREIMLEMMPLIGADRPWGYPIERIITRKLETVATLSRTAGRAEGRTNGLLEAAHEAIGWRGLKGLEIAKKIRALASDPAPGEQGIPILDVSITPGARNLKGQLIDAAALARDFCRANFPPSDARDLAIGRLETLLTLSRTPRPREQVAGMAVVSDSRVPPGDVEFRDDTGKLIGMITNIAPTVKAPAHPVEPAPGEQVAEDLPIFLPGGYGDRLSTAAETYLADYVYSPDPDGPYADHDLTDFERAMVEDFLAGLFAEKGFSSILQEMAKAGMRPAPAHPTGPGEVERLKQQLADVTSDYLRRHNDACDRYEELYTLRKGIAEAVEMLRDEPAHWGEAINRLAALSTPQPKGETARPTILGENLCEDCPPADYPTDATRCAPCPRRAALSKGPGP